MMDNCRWLPFDRCRCGCKGATLPTSFTKRRIGWFA